MIEDGEVQSEVCICEQCSDILGASRNSLRGLIDGHYAQSKKIRSQ